jgi:murein L,D-transpeptidase YcbB/YkuD
VVVSAAQVTVSPEVRVTTEPQTTAVSATADATTEAVAEGTPAVDTVATAQVNGTVMTVSEAIRAAALAGGQTPPTTPTASRATPVADTSGTDARAGALAPTAPKTPRTSASSTYPTLRRGSTGNAVRTVQQIMNYYVQCRSLPVEKLIVDGIYGVRTEAAVRAFQTQRGVSVDGIVSPTMWQLLQRDLANGGRQASC